MIVRLEICAAEKHSARSQYENNTYSVLVSADQLSIDRPEDLITRARAMFAHAKEAIHQAMRQDGLETGHPAPRGNGHDNNSRANGGDNGHAARLASDGQHHSGDPPRATEKQLRLIHQIAGQRRMDRDALEALCHEAVGHQSHELSKFDASRVITALKSEGGR